jgi:hypothetical protein
MKEQELFEYLKEKYYPDLELCSDQYNKFDCESDEYGVFIELKSRKTHYPTLLIEYAKYWHLMEKADDKSATPWYINSTPEGVFGFNLTEHSEPNWHTKRLPITTEFANRAHRNKLIGYLDVELGHRL